MTPAKDAGTDAGLPPANCENGLPDRSEIHPIGGDTIGHALVLDSNGCPHLSFYQNDYGVEVGRVQYARWDGSTWQHRVIEELPLDNWQNDLALDASDRPSIVYVDDGGTSLKLTRSDDLGQWTSETVAELGGVWQFAYRIDPAGHPVIAVLESDRAGGLTNPILSYFRRDDDGWHREEVFADGQALSLHDPLAFDSQGRPHLAVASGQSNQGLFYGYRSEDSAQAPVDGGAPEAGEDAGPTDAGVADAGVSDAGVADAGVSDAGVSDAGAAPRAWQGERFELGFDSVTTASLALDANDQPHILYCSRGSSSVSHYYRTESGWQTEVIEELDLSPHCGGIELDESNRLHVVYGRSLGVSGSQAGVELRHASWDGQGWGPIQILGEFERADVDLAVDSQRGVGHVLATIDTAPTVISRRTAVYFNFALDPPQP